MNQVPFIISANSITVFIGGAPSTVHKSHPHFADVMEYLKRRDHEATDLLKLVSIPKKIEGETFGAVTVGKDGKLYYKNVEVKSAMADKVLEVMKQGFPVDMWALFLNNLMENPSESAREEMHLFMEACSLPMTQDGHFLAYKRVKNNYTDCHTETIDNSVGQVVTMERSDVNSNRNQTCSTGLHFCSREYLNNFHGDRIMILKINPRDVVSIPSDYNNSKGRCCRYEVVGELGGDTKGYTTPTEQIDEIEKNVINDTYDSPAEEVFSEVCDECDQDVMDCDCWDEPDIEEYEADLEEASARAAVEDEVEITFTHKATGKTFSEEELIALITRASSIRALSKELEIPKSTMQDWAARLKAKQEEKES